MPSRRDKVTFQMALALSCFFAALPACAQTVTTVQGPPESIQVYTNDAAPVATDQSWKRTYKAGELKLIHPEQNAKGPGKYGLDDYRRPLPAGQVAAPVLPNQLPQPALATPGASSTSLMLMQGLKTALGDEALPLVRPSSATSLVPDYAGNEANSALATNTGHQVAGQAGTAAGAPEAGVGANGAAGSVQFVPGRAPQNLAAQMPQEAVAGPAAEAFQAAGPSGSQGAQPQRQAGHSIFGAPVNELAGAANAQTSDAGVNTTGTAGTNLSSESTVDAGGVRSQNQDVGSSSSGGASTAEAPGIFAQSAPTNAERAAQRGYRQATAAGEANSKCQADSTAWTKTCADAGYPESFVGQVTGETRTVCPKGDIKDVWLTNSCKEKPAAIEAAVPASAQAQAQASSTMAPASTPATAPLVAAPDEAIEKNLATSEPQAPAAPVAAQDKNTKDPKGLSDKGNAKVEPGPDKTSPLNIANEPAKPTMQPELTQAETPKPLSVQPEAVQELKKSVPSSEEALVQPEQAKLQGSGKIAACGNAAERAALMAPQDDLCASGEAGVVKGNNPWNWTCTDATGNIASCTTLTLSPVADFERSDKTQSPAVIDTPIEDVPNTDGAAPQLAQLPPEQTQTTERAPEKAEQAQSTEQGSQKTETDKVAGVSAGSGSETNTQSGIQTPPLTQKNSEVQVPAGLGEKQVGLDSNVISDSASSNKALADQPQANVEVQGKTSAVAPAAPLTPLMPEKLPEISSDKQSGNLSKSASVADKAALPIEAALPVECGSAAGKASFSAPKTELCLNGKASKVKGTGPWHWSCAAQSAHSVSALQSAQSAKGQKTHGAVITCESKKKVVGICGDINGTAATVAPTGHLCKQGVASSVKGAGPWEWTCEGLNSGKSVSCSVLPQQLVKVDGACGSAANSNLAVAPVANLCDAGVASTVHGEGPWSWACSGLNGGISGTCVAQKFVPNAPLPPAASVDGNCGTANGLATSSVPVDSLCSSGVVSSVSGEGPWNWSCIGRNGGMTVSCTAPLLPPAPVDGACGSANGVVTLTTPETGLCAAGIIGPVNGSGPWTWSCSGINGGAAAGCVAPLAGKAELATPSVMSVQAVGAVKNGSLVTPRLPAGSKPQRGTPTLPLQKAEGANMGAEPTIPLARPQMPAGSEMLQTPTAAEMAAVGQPVGQNAAQGVNSGSGSEPFPVAPLEFPDDAGTILFLRDSASIPDSSLGAVNKLALYMVAQPSARITLTAYADNADLTPREARRLSLTRALSVRDYLTTKGIQSSRVNVRALGANVSSGDPNRVDVRLD